MPFHVRDFGPPDLTVPGFGVPIGSAYLSARRTFGRPIGRPKVRPYLRPADSAGRRYGRTFGQPIGRPKVRLRGHRQGGTHTRRNTHKAEHTKGGL